MVSLKALMSPTKIPLLREKNLYTPATQSSDESPPPTPRSDYVAETHMKGATRSLIWGAFAPCAPIAIVSSVLLTAVLYNQIPKEYVYLQAVPTSISTSGTANNALHGIQQIAASGGDRAYWLYYHKWTSPGVLHMISSWTAKIMPFATGASMAIVGFFAGKRIIQASETKSEKLPSPHQVSLLPLAFWCLSFIIAMTFAIGAADSWFGTVVQAVQIGLVVPTANSTHSFGRDLIQNCTTGTYAARGCPSNPSAICQYPCSITNWTAQGQEREGLYNAQQAARTLMYNSPTNTVFNVTSNGSNYFFLGDVQSGQKLDFAASALAIKTDCQLETQNSILSPKGGFTWGNYTSPSFSYSGGVGVDPQNATSALDEAMVGIQFFDDATMTQSVGFGNETTALFAATNPLHFLVWSKGFPPVNTYGDEFGDMRKDHYLKSDINGDAVFILSCSATIYQTEYYWVNGSVVSSELETYEAAPDYYGAVYSAPFALNTALSHLALQDAAALAAYQIRPEGLSKVFADYFSRAAVAFTSGFSVTVTNNKEWTRDNSYLATRVPYAALYTLIALKAVYAIFALLLAVLAVFRTRPFQAQEVKERLTVNGLAAGFFEPHICHERGVSDVTDLFQEHHSKHDSKPHSSEQTSSTQKIGMVQTRQGGWLWVSVEKKAVNSGLGIQNHEVMSPVGEQSLSPGSSTTATSSTSPSHRKRLTGSSLGEGYTRAKDIV